MLMKNDEGTAPLFNRLPKAYKKVCAYVFDMGLSHYEYQEEAISDLACQYGLTDDDAMACVNWCIIKIDQLQLWND